MLSIGEILTIKITQDKIYFSPDLFIFKNQSDIRRVLFEDPIYFKIVVTELVEHGNSAYYIEANVISPVTPALFSNNNQNYFKIAYLRLSEYQEYAKGTASIFIDNLYSDCTNIYYKKINTFNIVEFNDLKFSTGSLIYYYLIPDHKVRIPIALYNRHISPKLAPLKTYFINLLGDKIKVDLSLTLKLNSEGKYLDHEINEVHSTAIERINSSIIYIAITRHLINQPQKNNKLVYLKDLLSESYGPTEKTEEEVTKEFLTKLCSSDYEYRHQQSINYLAKYHLYSKFYIRVFRSPFSFLFLIEGIDKYFFVLETLDEDFATYLWAQPKKLKVVKENFPTLLDTITKLNSNRNLFRQELPENCFRVIHDDISTKKDSFQKWKNKIEKIIRGSQ